MVEVAAKHRCPIVEVGTVTRELQISIGDEVFVDRERMEQLIRGFPFRKAKI